MVSILSPLIFDLFCCCIYQTTRKPSQSSTLLFYSFQQVLLWSLKIWTFSHQNFWSLLQPNNTPPFPQQSTCNTLNNGPYWLETWLNFRFHGWIFIQNQEASNLDNFSNDKFPFTGTAVVVHSTSFAPNTYSLWFVFPLYAFEVIIEFLGLSPLSSWAWTLVLKFPHFPAPSTNSRTASRSTSFQAFF